MKQALVIGATGSFGGHVATALINDGWQVKALIRSPDKIPLLHQGLEIVQGDARQIKDVRRASSGVDVIIYAANIPYPRWYSEALPLLEPSARVAEEQNLTLVFPGNVYVYKPKDGPDFDEQAPLNPVSKKGEIRERMELRLKLASTRGAQVLLIRTGDFIGANATGSWMHALTKATDRGYRLLRPGPRKVAHTWAYLPDVAQAVCQLLNRRERLPAYAPFHFAGYPITFDELVEAMQVASGRSVRVWPFPWWALTLLAPFVPFLRELREMRYLWRQEINLDDAKLRKELGGEIPNTLLPEALLQSGIKIRAR